MAFKLFRNNHILKKWIFMIQAANMPLQFTVSMYRQYIVFVCAVYTNLLHSKHILNTDLLRTKIKMSWERNKSSAKLDCSFVRSFISWGKFSDKRVTYTVVIYSFFRSQWIPKIYAILSVHIYFIIIPCSFCSMLALLQMLIPIQIIITIIMYKIQAMMKIYPQFEPLCLLPFIYLFCCTSPHTQTHALIICRNVCVRILRSSRCFISNNEVSSVYAIIRKL